ncbi:hypothetical protein MHU86_3322 [Fragilaria crotonensis]|nr:hypothetical protein MHU86_3322 [Fragilaria crotonensis]
MSLRSGRSATIRPKPNKKDGKRKKKCDLGSDCPYKDEYQHLMEFSHDIADRGHASARSVPGFRPFAGAGHTMPTSGVARNGSAAGAALHRSTASAVRPPLRQQEETIDLCHDPDTSVPLHSRKRASAKRKSKSAASSNTNAATMNSVIDLCDDDSGDDVTELKQPNNAKKKAVAKRPRIDHGIPSPSWPVAVSVEEEQRQLARAMAASNRDVVLDQDAEYYESLRKDQAKEQAKHDEEVRIREEEDMRRAIEESVTLAKEEKERSTIREVLDHQKQLEPEPPEGPDIATIAFRLPSECSIPRLERRFPVSARADQLISFLKSRVELTAIPKWTLRKVVGGTEILPTTALKDLGLAPRGIVVVRNEVN